MIDSDVVSHPEEFVEVYACRDLLEAQVIADQLLGPQGVSVQIRQLGYEVVPPPAGGKRHIAVPTGRAAESIRLIAAAREEGLLSHEGLFLAGLA